MHLLLDLDNTIYDTSTMPDELRQLYVKVITERSGLNGENLQNMLKDVDHLSLAAIAQKYKFPKSLITAAKSELNNYDKDLEIKVFDDYSSIKSLIKEGCMLHLVTSGNYSLQQKKIDALGIREDFISIHIDVDDDIHTSKFLIFKEILNKYELNESNVMVVGDNPDSEIKAAIDLGIHFKIVNRKINIFSKNVISDFTELRKIIKTDFNDQFNRNKLD